MLIVNQVQLQYCICENATNKNEHTQTFMRTYIREEEKTPPFPTIKVHLGLNKGREG